MDKKRIILGSGKQYYMDFTGDIPEDSEIEKEQNLLGLIAGGATLEYKPETYTAEDDLGLVSKTIITKEEVLLKLGLITFNAETFEVLTSTGRVSSTAQKRTIKIGGRGNDNGKSYLLRFVHDDPEDGKTRVTIVGKNQAGFSLAYAKDKESIVNPEFKAEPLDSEGTLIIYDEEIPGSAQTTSQTTGEMTEE